MNKTELIEHIAKNADISKAAAARALDATIGAVRAHWKKVALLRWSVQHIYVEKQRAAHHDP